MKINNDNVKKYSRIVYWFLSLLYWLGLIAAAACGIFFVIQFFLPESLFILKPAGKSMGFSFDNTVYFSVDPALYGSVNVKPLLYTFMPFLILILVMLTYGIRAVVVILKNVARGDAFAEPNIKCLALIGYDLIAASLVVSLAEVVTLSKVLELLKIDNVYMNFSMNIPFLIAGFLVLILSGVFRYGSYLKNEYDATI